MELIIKPTGRCNFCCTFCSASELKTDDNIFHINPEMKIFIEKTKPSRLIITGGDPLMMDPGYYYELHELVPDASISATTNLKDFYINPRKWSGLFKEPWFGISTSFQYGNRRMWDKNTVYDESMFIDVMNMYRRYVDDDVPPFISVIDYDNEDRAIDHVILAKNLGTVVKLNAALPIGRNTTWYPRYKMYQIYLDLIDKFYLCDYEANCIKRYTGLCPKNIYGTCNSNIRCCYVGDDKKLHVGICDEMIALGEEIVDVDEQVGNSPAVRLLPSDFIRPECSYCQLCMICNGCNINRRLAKVDPAYCDEMKKLEDRIVCTGWLL